MKQILLFIFIAFSFELYARQIEEITFSYWDKPDSTVYFSTPESIDENTKIILLVHTAVSAVVELVSVNKFSLFSNC